MVLAGKGIAARLAATQMLHAVLFDRRLLSDVLTNENSPISRLTPADRARAQSLATGVLRHMARLDAILDVHLEKPPPPKVKNTLRLAAYEMLADGAAPHGVVNAAVEIVRGSPKSGHLAGLVNAVARKVANDGAAIWADQSPQPLPSWLAKPLSKNFGAEIVPEIEVAHQAGAPIDLSLKDQDQADKWAELLKAEVLPNGSLRLSGRPQITALEGFETGDWWVQDAAASMPVRLMGDVKNLDVLDLCAAPGGKTMQLAAAGANVTALDVSEGRMVRVQENLDRTKLSAELVIADALKWQPEKKYDVILLDAPCSATGTIRRHPDLPFVKAGSDMSGLFQLQSDLLDAALGWLKPDGRLMYGTCSILPREGEKQIENALSRHTGLKSISFSMSDFGLEDDWQVKGKGVRLLPSYWAEKGGMDGFFIAGLTRGD